MLGFHLLFVVLRAVWLMELLQDKWFVLDLTSQVGIAGLDPLAVAQFTKYLSVWNACHMR